MATRDEYEKFLRDCDDNNSAAQYLAPPPPKPRLRLDGAGWFGALVAAVMVIGIIGWLVTGAT